jgi:hypothetical protein
MIIESEEGRQLNLLEIFKPGILKISEISGGGVDRYVEPERVPKQVRDKLTILDIPGQFFGALARRIYMAKINLQPFFDSHQVTLRRGEVNGRKVLLSPEQCCQVLGRRREKDVIGPHHYPKARLDLRNIATALGLEAPAITPRVVRQGDCAAIAQDPSQLTKVQKLRKRGHVDSRNIFPSVRWLLYQAAAFQGRPLAWEKGISAAFVIQHIWPHLNQPAREALIANLSGENLAEIFSCSAAGTDLQKQLFCLSYGNFRAQLVARVPSQMFDGAFIRSLPPDEQLAFALLMQKANEHLFKSHVLPLITDAQKQVIIDY